MSTNHDPSEEAAAGGQAASGSIGALGMATASVVCLALAFSIVALVAWGVRSAMGVGIGGAIAVANLVLFARIVRGILSSGGRNRIWVLVGIIKIFALFGGVWLLLRSGVVSALSLVVGYGALPLGIALGGLLAPPTPPIAGDDSSGPPDEDAAEDQGGDRKARK